MHNRPQKQVIKKIGFHLLTKQKVSEKKKKADGTEETVTKEKFVRQGELYRSRQSAQADGITSRRPYRVVGVRIDATPLVVTRERDKSGEVTIVKEA